VNYAVELGSGIMRDMRTKFHKDWFRHQKLIRTIQRHTDSMEIA
jgi:hypothetical protein